jgi:alpha-1,2-mannosyltransferase
MLMSEPVTATLRFGQINALVLWLVVEAFEARRASSPWIIGLAAAIKLTPLAFVPLMFGARRWRDGLFSVFAFLATVALGWIVQPTEAARYWSTLAVDARRVGGVAFVSNQSINGMLWRLQGPGGNRLAWAVSSIVVGLVCYLVGIRALRRGEWILAVGSVGLFSLLASPISWSHHWVLLTPMLVALGLRRTWTALALAVLGTAILIRGVIWWVPNRGDLEYQHHGWQIVEGNAYVLFGLVVVAYLSWNLRKHESPTPSPTVVEPRTATTPAAEHVESTETPDTSQVPGRGH